MREKVFPGRLRIGETPPGNSRRAERLLETALEVHGGEAPARTLRFVRMRGNWAFMNRHRVIRRESFGLHAGTCGDLRARFSGPQGERVLVANGRASWVRRGLDRDTTLADGIEHDLLELNPNLGLFARFLDGRLQLPWAPVRDGAGQVTRIRCCLRPRLWKKGARSPGPAPRLYEVRLDSRSGRVAGVVAFHPADGSFSPVETVSFAYEDFRAVEELLVPFRVGISSRQVLFARVTLQRFEVVGDPPDPGAPE